MKLYIHIIFLYFFYLLFLYYLFWQIRILSYKFDIIKEYIIHSFIFICQKIYSLLLLCNQHKSSHIIFFSDLPWGLDEWCEEALLFLTAGMGLGTLNATGGSKISLYFDTIKTEMK